jgi:mannose-6-phosphate isomerase
MAIMAPMRLLELGPNQIPRFYRGGSRIAAFRGLPPASDDAPEDWVASTTTVYGQDELGLTRLADGVRLADALAADPAFFEPTHLAAYGPDPALLVKLLDAGERLPLHFHPDDSFAAARLGARRGKTEAWFIVDADPGASVHVGFSRDIAEEELAELVDAQDPPLVLDTMHRLPVEAGDAIYVPAGLPHVIGEGILLLELQQPSDLSLLLEWKGVMTEREAFLGLSRELVLGAVERAAANPQRLTSRRDAHLFPSEADGFLRAQVVTGGDRLEPAFSVVVVVEGEGELQPATAEPVRVHRGSVVLVPFAAGSVDVIGGCRAVRCRPPLAAL